MLIIYCVHIYSKDVICDMTRSTQTHFKCRNGIQSTRNVNFNHLSIHRNNMDRTAHEL